jgi:hypothetical protein
VPRRLEKGERRREKETTTAGEVRPAGFPNHKRKGAKKSPADLAVLRVCALYVTIQFNHESTRMNANEK